MTKLSATKRGIVAKCEMCNRMKRPRGRCGVAAQILAGSLCDWDCRGYSDAPKVGQLWPDESEKEYGHSVPDYGTTEARDGNSNQER